jgi:CRP-like cAMP-binding protein
MQLMKANRIAVHLVKPNLVTNDDGACEHALSDVKSHARLLASLSCVPAASEEPILLRPQQRLTRTVISSRRPLAVREGVLAIDIVPGNRQRQILDFLMPGDLVPTSEYLCSGEVSIRALTAASMIRPHTEETTRPDTGPQGWEVLFGQLQSQLARTNIHQLAIGHHDAESRAATFLFGLTLRSKGIARAGMRLALPMSRQDIADYLAMNPDTLSRIMMRFETIGVIERINRHAIRIADIQRLGLLTPFRGMLLAALGDHADSEVRAACTLRAAKPTCLSSGALEHALHG